jgi:hypothetical protein
MPAAPAPTTATRRAATIELSVPDIVLLLRRQNHTLLG